MFLPLSRVHRRTRQPETSVEDAALGTHPGVALVKEVLSRALEHLNLEGFQRWDIAV